MLWNEFWGAFKITIKNPQQFVLLFYWANEQNFVKKIFVDYKYFGGSEFGCHEWIKGRECYN